MQLAKRIKRVEELLGHNFQNKELLAAALTHPSAAEHDVIGCSYQRLEFWVTLFSVPLLPLNYSLAFPIVMKVSLPS